MVKSIEKIFIVSIVVCLAFGIIGLNYSFASEASIAVSPAKVNKEFTVTVNIPNDAVAYEGKIEVTFSNGTTLSSGKLTKVTGMDGTAMAYPGNMTATFKAASSGEAKVKVIGLIISGNNSNQLNSKTTLEQSIVIEGETPAPAPTQTPAPTTSTEAGYTATGDTVYATENLNVRNGASTTSGKIGSLKQNASTKRIAVGNNGWDKIEFNGGVGYVVSKYLTTKAPGTPTNTPNNTTDVNNTVDNNKVQEPNWTTTGDTVYSKKSLNVREGCGTSFKPIGGLTIGQKVKRIAVGDNGWDKIDFNGKDAYVMSKYLTTSKSEANKLVEEQKQKEENAMQNNTVDSNTINNTVDNTTNTVANNTVNNNVVSNNTTSNNVPTNEEIYNTIVQEVGVIPQVGRSIVDYIYGISVLFGVIIVLIIGNKIYEKNEE